MGSGAQARNQTLDALLGLSLVVLVKGSTVESGDWESWLLPTLSHSLTLKTWGEPETKRGPPLTDSLLGHLSHVFSLGLKLIFTLVVSGSWDSHQNYPGNPLCCLLLTADCGTFGLHIYRGQLLIACSQYICTQLLWRLLYVCFYVLHVIYTR